MRADGRKEVIATADGYREQFPEDYAVALCPVTDDLPRHANYRITLDMYVGTTAGVLDRAHAATQ